MKIQWLSNPIREVASSAPRSCCLYKVQDAKLTSAKSYYYPNILIHAVNQLYLPINEKFMSFNKKTFYEEQGMILTTPVELAETLQVESTPVFFFVYNVENYYHFIYDALPYLWWYFYLKKEIPELCLVTQLPTPKHQKMFKFVEETFAILNIPYILLDKHTLYKTMYVSTSLTHGDYSNEPPNPEAWDVWNMLVQKGLEMTCTIDLHRKIYVSRRTHLNKDNSNIGTNYTQRRKMMNEDELVNRANLEGYVEVFPEQWSMSDKIHAFQYATHVVGAIGGGLCNLLFSPASTHSSILVSPFFMEINNRFKYSMDHTQTHYCYHTRLDTLCKGLAKYMRVKILQTPYKGVYGEIADFIAPDKLVVVLGDDTSVSLTAEQTQTTVVSVQDVAMMDGGLNSPFWVEVSEIWFK